MVRSVHVVMKTVLVDRNALDIKIQQNLWSTYTKTCISQLAPRQPAERPDFETFALSPRKMRSPDPGEGAVNSRNQANVLKMTTVC